MFTTDWVDFFLPSKIRLEYDSASRLGEWITHIGSRPVIIKAGDSDVNYDDEINIVKNGLVKYTGAAIVYDELTRYSAIDHIDSASHFVRQAKADSIVIAGSVDIINLGKAVALLATNRISAADLLKNRGSILYDALPIIIVPLEPTMGEELLSSFTLFEKEKAEFDSICHDSLVPKVCLYDPKFSTKLTQERASWIITSLVSYCIESSVSAKLNPFTETLLTQAMTYIYSNALNFYDKPYVKEFSTTMFWASAFIGASANTSPQGMNWALGKVLYHFFNINFYHSQAILLPYVMEFYLTTKPQIFINIARIFGADISGLSKIEAAIRAVERVRAFFQDLNMPYALSQVNFDKRIIPLAASLALKLPQMKQTVKKIDKEVIEAFLLAAI